MTGIIALNELRRRLRDRSVLITSTRGPPGHRRHLGLRLLPAAPDRATAHRRERRLARGRRARPRRPNCRRTSPCARWPRASQLEREVADGTLAGGVVAYPVHRSLGDLLIPMVSPGATTTPGFKVVDRADALVGEETAQAVAAGLASRLYADAAGHGRGPRPRAARGRSRLRRERGQGGPRLLRPVDRRRLSLHRERPRHALAPVGTDRRHAGAHGGRPPSARVPSSTGSCWPSGSPD